MKKKAKKMKTQLLTIMINLERIEFLNKKINLNNKIMVESSALSQSELV